MTRKLRLIDCNPKWRTWSGRDGTDEPDAIQFDCPEGHVGCYHIIPFTPSLDGSPQPTKQRNGAQWTRCGDTFETLVLTPSIRRIPSYKTRSDAIAAGCSPEYIDDSLTCAFHGFIGGDRGNKPGAIEFCADSR